MKIKVLLKTKGVPDEPILYPYLTQPDILVAMLQGAHARFGSDLKPGGLLLYE